jgi:acyl carrier protein
VYLLNEQLQPVPIGVAGEVYIGGDGLARDYLKRPELTAQKFIPNPFSQQPGARLYKTGDLARYNNDGQIEFLGRLDNQVKIRGFRIELGEIELLLQQHPSVRETVVVAREDVPGNKRLVAYVVVNQMPAPTISELHHFLKAKLPEYMVPSAIILLEVLPLTPNGKVDRQALPAPDTARPELENIYVSPRTPVEEVLAAIWEDVFDIEQVGIYDNFFELGGNSLLATQLMSRVQETLQVDVSLQSFFETATIADLAALILRDSDERVKVERTAQLILSLAQLSEDEVEQMITEQTSLGRV